MRHLRPSSWRSSPCCSSRGQHLPSPPGQDRGRPTTQTIVDQALIHLGRCSAGWPGLGAGASTAPSTAPRSRWADMSSFDHPPTPLICLPFPGDRSWWARAPAGSGPGHPTGPTGTPDTQPDRAVYRRAWHALMDTAVAEVGTSASSVSPSHLAGPDRAARHRSALVRHRRRSPSERGRVAGRRRL
jgi:hypothetical protein